MREIQLFNACACTYMYHAYVKQTDRHAERNRVYTQYYVYFCQLCMSIGIRTCMYVYTCTYVHVPCHKIKLGDFQWQAARRMVTDLEGDSEGEGGKGNGEN